MAVVSLPTGKYTPQQLHADLHDNVQSGVTEDMVVMWRNKDEGYQLAYSHMTDEELIFIITLAKQELVNRLLYGDYDGE